MNDEHSHLYKVVFEMAVKDRQMQAVLAEEFILCAWTMANKQDMMLLNLSIKVAVQQGWCIFAKGCKRVYFSGSAENCNSDYIIVLDPAAISKNWLL